MPIEDDLIQRTLAELAATLTRLELRPEPAAVDAARDLLDRAYHRHLGVAGDVVRRLPSEQLLAVISTTGRVDAERAFLIAALLEFDAAMPFAGHAASLLRLRALDLYTEAGSARVGVADLYDRVRRVRAALLEHVLPEVTFERLLRYLVRDGRFAIAEDLLFEWLEDHGATTTLRAAGERFYDDLEGRTDEHLLAGELPRDELADGRAMFRRSCDG